MRKIGKDYYTFETIKSLVLSWESKLTKVTWQLLGIHRSYEEDGDLSNETVKSKPLWCYTSSRFCDRRLSFGLDRRNTDTPNRKIWTIFHFS